MIRPNPAVLTLIATALLAAGLPGQQPAPSPHDALLAADRDLARAVMINGVAGGIGSALTADGVLVWPGAAVVRGPARAASLLRLQPGLSDARIAWQPLHAEVAPDGSLGLVWGVMALTHTEATPAAGSPRLGRFLAAWRHGAGGWRLEALAITGILSGNELHWEESLGPVSLPRLPGTGPAGPFVRADSAFSALAGKAGAAEAFRRYAAPDAHTFAGSGELNIGPAAIAEAVAGSAAWEWGAVAAGAANDGSLGWTVGEATITSKGADGSPSAYRGKYLTLWRRMPDGGIRFIADGGNGRP